MLLPDDTWLHGWFTAVKALFPNSRHQHGLDILILMLVGKTA